jgi:4'-phosphopantetheinyl transferase EntD
MARETIAVAKVPHGLADFLADKIHWFSLANFRVALWAVGNQPDINMLAIAVSPETLEQSKILKAELRRKEWLATRTLSRYLTGLEPISDDFGRPIWSDEWQGSISHKSGHVALWCAQRPLNACGIDLESCREFEPAMGEKIMNDQEQLIISRAVTDFYFSMIFAAKEAIYKVLFPLVEKKFYFDAALLTGVYGGHPEFQLDFLIAYDLSADVRAGRLVRVAVRFIDIDGGNYWLAVAFLR